MCCNHGCYSWFSQLNHRYSINVAYLNHVMYNCAAHVGLHREGQVLQVLRRSNHLMFMSTKRYGSDRCYLCDHLNTTPARSRDSNVNPLAASIARCVIATLADKHVPAWTVQITHVKLLDGAPKKVITFWYLLLYCQQFIFLCMCSKWHFLTITL